MTQENLESLSESIEMYLVTIYRLTRDGNYTSGTAIAERLGISCPSVSERVKHLTEQGYLIHECRQGVKLSAEGERVAIQIVRRHRLIETFLVRVVGYALDEVHAEACGLEHAMSERLVNQLEMMLGYPQVDPHGHPIPTAEGVAPEIETQPLADVLPGKKVQIFRVEDWDQDYLAYLHSLQLIPGVEVRVVETAPLEGPLTLNIDDKTVVVDRAIAREIGVISIPEVC
jgi:DtxR family transcriptional regulator, Mn-dependent transcriptional regulator